MKKHSDSSAVTLTAPFGGATHCSSMCRVLTKVLALILLGFIPQIRHADADASTGRAHLVTKEGSYSEIASLQYTTGPTVNCDCPRRQVDFVALATFEDGSKLVLRAAGSDILSRAACPNFVRVEALLNDKTLYVGSLVNHGDRYHGLVTKQFGPAKYEHVQVWNIEFQKSNRCS